MSKKIFAVLIVITILALLAVSGCSNPTAPSVKINDPNNTTFALDSNTLKADWGVCSNVYPINIQDNVYELRGFYSRKTGLIKEGFWNYSSEPMYYTKIEVVGSWMKLTYDETFKINGVRSIKMLVANVTSDIQFECYVYEATIYPSSFHMQNTYYYYKVLALKD